MTGGNNQSHEKPPSLQDQADFIYDLRRRCTMRDGSIAGKTWMSLSDDDVRALEVLRARLERMAPYEAEIRRVVTGRRG